MATSTTTQPRKAEPEPGALLRDIGKDLAIIAKDELDLTRGKLTEYLERLVARAGLVVFGACVALIGLAMLCVVAVIALEPVIAALWLRLFVMALVYLAIGGGAAYLFARRLAKGPDLENEVDEVGQTFDAVERGLKH